MLEYAVQYNLCCPVPEECGEAGLFLVPALLPAATAEQQWASGWHYASRLGAPSGPATFVNGKTWVRDFAYGAQARYDIRTGNGKVTWSHSNEKIV